MKSKIKNKAFTLVEVFIVIIIVGLLAAMAIPAFNRVRAQAKADKEKEQASANTPNIEQEVKSNFKTIQIDTWVYILKDEVTGKEYIINHNGGIILREPKEEKKLGSK